MRFSAHEAETLKKIITDETGPLLERIEKLETELAAQRKADAVSKGSRK